MSTSINRYLGDMDPRECRVPPGARLVSLKYCEACGGLFARSNGDKYCRPCHASPAPLNRDLELRILAELKAEVPLAL